MPLKKGEVYQCPNKNCGCEVTVIKEAPSDCSGTQNPTCCCGKNHGQEKLILLSGNMYPRIKQSICYDKRYGGKI
ncbi:hypothetical protein [Fodinibius sp. SL11]|uniref:hypothetical protein n=1 Tax=Fodinibius sp. SL11 TaxID=3425690 RepID=UPI003F884753